MGSDEPFAKEDCERLHSDSYVVSSGASFETPAGKVVSIDSEAHCLVCGRRWPIELKPHFVMRLERR